MIEFELQRTGLLMVVSAPSGGGKSTIIKSLLDKDPSLTYAVSATTRPPRRGESHGSHYYFYSQDEFRSLIEHDMFYEHALVHGNYYGTLKSEVDRKLREGQDIILDLDVQGSLNLKKSMPEAASVFILPPSIATLEKRLRDRGLDEEDVIRRRLANARGEVRMADRYDYILVNRDLDETIGNMKTILMAERFRSARLVLKDGRGGVLLSSSSER